MTHPCSPSRHSLHCQDPEEHPVADIALQGRRFGVELSKEEWPAALVRLAVVGAGMTQWLEVWQAGRALLPGLFSQQPANLGPARPGHSFSESPSSNCHRCRCRPSCTSWSASFATAPACGSAVRCRSVPTFQMFWGLQVCAQRLWGATPPLALCIAGVASWFSCQCPPATCLHTAISATPPPPTLPADDDLLVQELRAGVLKPSFVLVR